MRAVSEGDDDELRRLGFGGFNAFVQRLADIMGDSLRQGLDGLTDDESEELFTLIMQETARPMHYAHHLVNEAGAAIQAAEDKPLNIHIKPVEPEFNDKRFKSAVGDAVGKDEPRETLKNTLPTAVKAMGNDFTKANAEARSRAGFEVTVKRTGSSKACPWCAARIGSWTLAGAPDGVFGCHDNCSCTVEYVSSTGAKSRRVGTGRFVDVKYEPPHVGVVQGAENLPHRLTGKKNDSIIKLSDQLVIINLPLIIAAKNFQKMTERQLVKSSRTISKRMEEHKGYIDNPYPHVPGWDNLEEREKSGLKKHWEHEIENFEKQLEEIEEELENRKNET